jgi:hypothetical protein
MKVGQRSEELEAQVNVRGRNDVLSKSAWGGSGILVSRSATGRANLKVGVRPATLKLGWASWPVSIHHM